MAGIADSLKKLMEVDGSIACALVDYNSGMVLGKAGGGIDLDIAGGGNVEVLKSKMKVMKALGIPGSIEDILITLEKQYHILRPLASKPGLFMYFVLDKAKSNLGMARYKTGEVETELTV